MRASSAALFNLIEEVCFIDEEKLRLLGDANKIIAIEIDWFANNRRVNGHVRVRVIRLSEISWQKILRHRLA